MHYLKLGRSSNVGMATEISLLPSTWDRSREERFSSALHADHGLAWKLDQLNGATWRRLILRINMTLDVGSARWE